MGLRIIKLTNQQKDCVKFASEGDMLIRGVPGCGKTTVILERASYLIEKEIAEGNEPRILMLTYSNTLSKYIKQLARTQNSISIEARTFHQWGRQLLVDAGISIPAFLTSEERLEKIRHAKNYINKVNSNAGNETHFPRVQVKGLSEDKALVKFLSEEFAWIKRQGIQNRIEYMSIQRAGRGNHVQVYAQHRTTIYDVYTKYLDFIIRERKIEFDDVALLLIKYIDTLKLNQYPDHILIDEAQDLSPMQFKAVKLLTGKSLTIAADKGQQIYRNQFTWRSVQIDIRGSRSRFLSQSFRSTKQIVQLARSLQKHDVQLLKDDEYYPAEDPEASGDKPVHFISDNLDEEVNLVIHKVRELRQSCPNDTIAVIAHSAERLKVFEEALSQFGIPCNFIKEEEADFTSPGVKLVNYYACKGLEFHHVIVSGLKNGIIPFYIKDADDPEAFLATERRKLYVAMTRAQISLILSAVNPVSPFLGELDSNLYD